MKIFWPFSRSGREWESGNVLLLTGMIATATAVAGGKVMLDRTLAQRKASQLAENTKRAKEIPGSAAMIAKALISLPPHVSGNKSLEWTSDKLQSVPKNRPRIYPIPYTSGTVGGPAQPATAVSQSATPESGANWKMPKVENTSKEGGAILSAQVYVYTNDSSRTATQDVNSAISSKSVAGGSETIKRTESLVTYSFRNCDEDNRSSPTFTGRYCASAIIKTDNYVSSVKGKDTATGTTNKVAVELGGIEPPPPPVIESVSTSDNGPLRKNTKFSLVVKATGVATGYTVTYGGTELATTWPNKLNKSEPRPHQRLTLDHLYEKRELVISDISSSALNAVFDDPCVNSVTLNVTLHGITGPDPTFPQSFDVVKNLVSCVPNSFFVSRVGADQRSCSFELKKDNGSGTVKSVAITQKNNSTNAVTSHTFASPSFASNNKWTNPTSPAFVCSEDSLTFSGALERESSCPTPSISQCTPTNVNIPELLPVCSTFSAGRTPGTLTECTLTIDRAPNSHSVVDIFVNNTLQTGGNWSGNKWTMTNYSCGLGASSFTARLARGTNSVPCGSESVNVSAISWCNPNSTFVKRVPGDPSKCTMRLTKNSNAAVADITSKKVSTTTLAASTSITGGTWATHEWTSPQFNCPLGQTSYLGSLTGKDNRVSECGWSVLPSEPPVCGDFNFTRPTPTSTTCNLTMKKGLDSGPITEARLNGGVMSPADQDTYTTTVQCPLNSSTTVTGSLTNARGTVTCGPATVPAAVCYSDAVGGVSSEIPAAGRKYRIHRFASVGASQNFEVTSNCKPFEVLVVAGGGGGGTGRAAGGGGAGGVIYNTNYQFSSTGSFPVTVGAGGAVNARGSNSSIAQILIAQGGGFGGRGEGQSPQSGGAGGSGGGGGFKGNFGAGAGTPNQGHNGGKNRNGNWIGGGGGGGFAQAGQQAGEWSSSICSPLPSCGMGGPGGIGLGTSISGTPRNYAGGGSGCGEQKRGEISSFGGGQGGRDGVAGSSGLAGTGGGGGGCGNVITGSGAGGSGVVIIRYEIAP
jgi:hypothetical protein